VPRIPALAKLTTPGLGDIIARPRLRDRLNGLEGRRLIWIAAPGGSGKTTLVADWLRSGERRHLWYQVDAADRDVASFFNYLALAAERESRLRRKLTRFTPEYRLGLPAFTRNFFRELCARLKPPAVIVLDNYQDAGAESDLDLVLAQAIEELPADMLIVVTSRSALPAALARHEANGVVGQIGSSELELTEEEEAALVRAALGERRLKSADRTRLRAATRGWMTGLLLALREVKANAAGAEAQVISAIADASSQDPARIFDYFAAEVLARFDPASREFLYAVALLPNMTASICAALTGNNEARTILQRLEREHFFTTRRGLLVVTYEFHPLFRQFLLARAPVELDAERWRALERRAGRLLAEAGEGEAAVSLLAAAQEWSTLAELVREHGATLEKEGRHQTLLEWVTMLPEDVRAADPWLLYWHGTALLPTNPFEAYLLFDRAYPVFREHQDVSGQYLGWVGAATALIFRHDDMHPARAWLDDLDRLRKQHARWPSFEVRGKVTIAAFNLLMMAIPQHPSLPRWLGEAEKMFRFIPLNEVRCYIGAQLGMYYFFFGQPGKLDVMADQLQQYVDSPRIAPLPRLLAVAVLIWRGWHCGQEEKTRRAVEQGLELIRESGVYITAQWVLLAAAIASLSYFRFDEAEEFLARYRARMQPGHRLEVGGDHYIAGWLALGRHEWDLAASQFEHAVEVLAQLHNPYFEAQAHFGLAQARIAQGRLEQARPSLDAARRISTEIGYVRMAEYYCNYLESWLLEAQGRIADSLRLLKQGFEAAARNGWLAHAVGERELMARLCARALQHGIEPEYTRRLIGTYHLRPPADGLIEQWPYPLKLYTLGRFSLVVGERDRGDALPSGKPLELLKALIALGGRQVDDSVLSETLWPDAEGDAARRTLDVNLHRLRKLIGVEEALVLEHGKLSLDPRHAWVDAWALERGLSALEAAVEDDAPDLPERVKAVLALYRGPFLREETDAAWALGPRERLQRRVVRAGGEALAHLAAAGCWPEVIAACERLLALDPLFEDAYRYLMRAYGHTDQRAEGLKTFERCRAVFQRELGIGPGAQTVALMESLRAGGA